MMYFHTATAPLYLHRSFSTFSVVFVWYRFIPDDICEFLGAVYGACRENTSVSRPMFHSLINICQFPAVLRGVRSPPGALFFSMGRTREGPRQLADRSVEVTPTALPRLPHWRSKAAPQKRRPNKLGHGLATCKALRQPFVCSHSGCVGRTPSL